MPDEEQHNPEPASSLDDSSANHGAPVDAQQAVATSEQDDPAPVGEADDATGEHQPVPTQSADDESTDDGSAEPKLSEVDTALAGEVDSLIEGDYQQAEQALHHDSQAVAVDIGSPDAVPGSASKEQSPGAASDSAHDDPSVEESSAGDPPLANPAPPEPVEPQATADQSEASPKSRDEPVDDGEASTPAPAAEPVPEPAPEPVAAQSPAPSPVKPQPTAPVEVETPAPAVAAASTAKPAPPARDSARDSSQEAPASTGSPVKSHLVRFLQCVNSPLRLLPPWAREVVDWIALSLVFWVPIVWLIALLVVGR